MPAFYYFFGARFQGPQTLREYALPLDKAPLFVGRTGMLLWQETPSEPLSLRVFPLSPGGTRRQFSLPDGGTLSMANELESWQPEALQLLDSSGKPVTFWEEPATGAIRFPVQAGQQYRLVLRGES